MTSPLPQHCSNQSKEPPWREFARSFHAEHCPMGSSSADELGSVVRADEPAGDGLCSERGLG